MSVTDTSAPPAPPREQEMNHRQILEVLAGLLAALFTAILSSTIVSNALPTIISDLDGSQSQYTWVITTSLLATTVSTPIWGKLSDLFNKKMLVQLAIVIFVIGSVFAGVSQNITEMLAARTFQGLGMGGLIALAQSIIGSVIPPRQRGRYSGYMGAVMGVATMSGPLIGGVIVDTSFLGWRWCFFVCVPLALVSLAMLQKFLHIETVRRKVSIDYVGAVLIAVAASLPLLWVTFAADGDFAWVSVTSAAFVLGTLAAIVALVLVESRHPEPLLPLRVVRERTTALAIVGSLGVGIAMFGGTIFLGQYFQVARGYSAAHAGLLTIPLMMGSLVGTAGAGQMITRTGSWKRYLVAGSVLLTGGLGMLGLVTSSSTPLIQLFVFMALMGLGTGMLMQNLVLAVQNTVDVTEIGAASGTVAFFRTLGGAIGVSVLGAILASRVSTLSASGLSDAGIDAGSSTGSGGALDFDAMPAPVAAIVRGAYGDATATIFLVAAAVALTTIVAVVAIREVPLRTTVRKYDDAGDGGTGAGDDASGTAGRPEPVVEDLVQVDLTAHGDHVKPVPADEVPEVEPLREPQHVGSADPASRRG